jgi:hypothetical protein
LEKDKWQQQDVGVVDHPLVSVLGGINSARQNIKKD